MKNICSVVAVVAAVAVAVYGSTSGECGDNCKFTVTSGTLDISGSGAMTDFTENNVPWASEKTVITKVVIQKDITSIGSYAFQGYSKLTSVSIAESVTKIGNNAFSHVPITTLDLNSVVSIGANAFEYTSLTTLTIPDSVKSIGPASFMYSNINKMTIGAGLESIGDSAFFGCTKLATIVVNESNTHFVSVEDVLFDHDKSSVVLYAPVKSNTTYEIPDTVKSFASRAFAYATKLDTVTIPDGVSIISDGAFSFCTYLKNITIPESVVAIGDNAFESCSYLTSITIPNSVISLGKMAFASCIALVNVALSDNLDSIGESAFYKCTGLKSMTLPEKLVSIGKTAFSGCSALNNISLPGSLKSIGESAFASCTALTSINIPENVKTIERKAFNSCNKLASVFYQGAGVLSEPTVFDDCTALKNICVSPDCDAIQFCGKFVTSSNPVCQTFRGLFNHCYKGEYVVNEFVEVKRKNTTDWEALVEGCVHFDCDNATGRIAWSMCNRTDELDYVCSDAECSANTSLRIGRPSVVMDLVDGVTVMDINSTTVLTIISAKCKVDKELLKVGWEATNEGNVAQIVAYVDKEKTAKSMAKIINAMNKGEGCRAGILCKVNSAYALEAVAAASTLHAGMKIIVLMLLVTVIGMRI